MGQRERATSHRRCVVPMSLHPYQAALVSRVYTTWAAGSRSVVLQLGTGGGKTHTAASILREETGPVVSVSYTHLTLPTTLHECRSRWSPYH